MEEQENSESSNENEQKTLTSPLAEVEMLEDTTFTPILHKESNHFAMPDWAQAPNPEKLVEILPEIYRHLAQFDKTDAGKEDSYKNLNLGDRLRHHAVENAGNPEFSSKFTAFASIYDMTFRLYSSFRENNVDTEHKMNAILNLSGYYNDLYGKDTTAEIAKILAIAEDTPSSPIIHVPQSGNKLQNAFTETFVDQSNLVDRLLGDIREMAAKWNRSEYYSPYTSIVQSSGCGKTRTVLEFSRSNWVFFVCFRETGSTGYPYRSFIADYLSKGALDFIRWNTKDHSLATAPISECDLVKLFYMSSWIACIRELKAHLEQSDFDCHEDYFKSWIGQQMQVDNTTGLIGTVFWRSILERTVRVLRGVNSSDFDNFRQQLYEQMVVSYKKLDQTIDTIGLFENDKCPRPMALLALDEASELSNRQIDQEKMLQLFRNAFGVIVPDRTRKADTRPKTLSFAILTDTQTKLVNFHPKYLPDRSKRRRQPTKLFDPLWLISNWNVDLEIADVSTEQQLKEFALKCGRYLWRCYSDCDYEEVVNLAGEKLLCVAALEGEVICTRNQAMALLGCRLALNFHAFASFIPELCSSHMAACLHVFENTDRILGSYPSEPVLADASAMISQNHLQFKISILLKYLRNEIREGVVEAGYRGELVAKILLLLARDSAVIVSKGNAPVHSFVQMTSVYNYLVSLCGKANIDSNFEHLTEDDFGKRFLNGGVVYFTHFAYVTYTPSRETMCQFFNRGAAIFCKRNQVGIDLIIPVKMVDGEWSFILVTVKNYASKSNEATLAPFKSSAEKSKTDTGKAPFPYLVLFMDINPSQPSQVKMISAEMRKTRQQSSQAKKNFPVTIAVTGLSDTIYPFISMYQGLHEELKSLAVAWVEPISFQTDNAKRNDLIRMTLPAYSPYDSVTRKADADVFLNANESQIGDAIKIQTDEELPEVPQAKYIRLNSTTSLLAAMIRQQQKLHVSFASAVDVTRRQITGGLFKLKTKTMGKQ